MPKTLTNKLSLAELVGNLSKRIPSLMTQANGSPISASVGDSSYWDRIDRNLSELSNLGPDWDGQGAKAPLATCLTNARQMLQVLHQSGFQSPSRVTAGPDGEVILEWQNATSYLEAEVNADQATEWMLAEADLPPVHWTTY